MPKLVMILIMLVLSGLQAFCAPAYEITVSVPAGGPTVISQKLSEATVCNLVGTPTVWVSGGASPQQLPSQWRTLENDGGILTWVRPQIIRAQTYRIRTSESTVVSPENLIVATRQVDDELVVDTGVLTVHHALKAGGLPSGFRPRGAEKITSLRWQDRLYSDERGEWLLDADTTPQVTVNAVGPLQIQVVVTARYMKDGVFAPGNPDATYTFTYTAGSEVVGLDVVIRSTDGYSWLSLHTAELTGLIFNHFYIDEDNHSVLPIGSDKFTYADSAVIGGNAKATLGIIRDPADITSEEDKLALWDPAPGENEGQWVQKVPPYIRGPWLWGWYGEYRHTMNLVFASATFSQEDANRLVSNILHPPSVRLTTARLNEFRQTSNLISSKPQNDKGGWWLQTYLSCNLQRRLSAIFSQADMGEVAEAEAQCQDLLTTYEKLQNQKLQFATGSQQATWAAETDELVTAGTSETAATLATTIPVRIASLCKPGGQDLAREECEIPVLRAMLKLPDGTEILSTGKALHCISKQVYTNLQGAGFTVSVAEEVAPGINLRAEISCQLQKDSPDTRWNLNVQVEGAKLLWVRFPNIACAPIGGTEALSQQIAVSPRALDGNFIRQPFGSPRLPERTPFGSQWDPATMMYPQLSMPVQMTCLFRETSDRSPADVLYFATEDPQGFYKAFQYVAFKDNVFGQGLEAGFVHVPEGPETATQYQTPYNTLLTPLTGDWFAAVEHYRTWAVNQPWCVNGTMATRTDQAEWIHETPVWFFGNNIYDGQVQSVSDCADMLGVPVASHLYDWHKNQFDSRMPEYFPPRRGDEGFRQDLQTWRDHNIKTVPYIQGVLWDMLSQTWVDEGVEPYAVRDKDGQIVFGIYNKGTVDEGHCAEICMTNDFWHEKLESYVQKLSDFGVDGVYLDSVGCGSSPCYATNHNHVPGRGGHWWTDGVRTLMTRLKKTPGPDGKRLIFTTEAFTESCLDGFDAFLPHMHHPRPDEGCVYDALYHDYTVFHGAHVGTWDPYKPDGTLPQVAARCFALGRPLGWFYHGLYNYYYLRPEAAPDMAFLRELSLARMSLTRFLGTGQMAHPPQVLMQKGVGEGVLASMWQAGNEIMVTVVNGSMEPCDFQLRLATPAHGKTLEAAWPENADNLTSAPDGLTPVLHLDGRSTRAWVMKF